MQQCIRIQISVHMDTSQNENKLKIKDIKKRRIYRIDDSHTKREMVIQKGYPNSELSIILTSAHILLLTSNVYRVTLVLLHKIPLKHLDCVLSCTLKYKADPSYVQGPMLWGDETHRDTVMPVFGERQLNLPHIGLYVDHTVQGVLAPSGRPADHISMLVVRL